MTTDETESEIMLIKKRLSEHIETQERLSEHIETQDSLYMDMKKAFADYQESSDKNFSALHGHLNRHILEYDESRRIDKIKYQVTLSCQRLKRPMKWCLQ